MNHMICKQAWPGQPKVISSHPDCIAHSVVLSLDDEGGCMLHLGILHMLNPAEHKLLLAARPQHLELCMQY